jgi:hypothetical protein
MNRESEAADPQPLMRIIEGLWAAKTLAAAVELDLFTHISRSGRVSMETLGQALRLQPRPMDILLTACAGLGLLVKDGDSYRNSELSEVFLVRGGTYYLGGYVESLDRRNFPGWLRVMDALRGNRPVTWDPGERGSLFDGEDPILIETFWEGMYSVSMATARAFAEVVDMSGVRRLLDVGGGGGAYGIELSKRYPELKTTVYDLPLVCSITQKKISDAGFADRVDTLSGDFFTDPELPSGYDAMLLSMVLHDWGEADCRSIIGKCAAALAPGGRLIITELFVLDDKSGPQNAALMSMNMLVETMGRNYTAGEYRAWLAEAGLTGIAMVEFSAPRTNGALVARKPVR